MEQESKIAYRSATSGHQPREGLGTVILKGGNTGVEIASDARGKATVKLSGTVYNHDSAVADTFVVALQPGVSNYRNALRGFRHGVDKIDLRQTGITHFSQLSISRKDRGVINGVAVVHGVEVTFKGASGEDSNVNLLYLDNLETSQLNAADFLFSEHAPAVVLPVTPVTPPDPFVYSGRPLPFIPTMPKPFDIPLSRPVQSRPIASTSEDPNTIVIKKTFADVTLGDESKTINVRGFSNKVVAGNGDNKVNVRGSWSDIRLGDGNNFIGGNISKVRVGNGNNTIESTDSFAEVTAGDGNNHLMGDFGKLRVGNGNNTIKGHVSFGSLMLGDGNNIIVGDFSKLNVGDGNNTITDTATFAEIKLGDGNNHAILSGLMSTVEVGHGVNDLTFKGWSGHLVFGSDISPERLWFRHAEQDLTISVIGSTQAVTVHNWYADKPERPRDIMAGDHHRLYDRDVENLVQAMAGFSPPTSATFTPGSPEQQQLQPVLAANWH